MARTAEELAAWAATPWPQLGLRSETELTAALAEFTAALGEGGREYWLGRKRGVGAARGARCARASGYGAMQVAAS